MLIQFKASNEYKYYINPAHIVSITPEIGEYLIKLSNGDDFTVEECELDKFLDGIQVF